MTHSFIAVIRVPFYYEVLQEDDNSLVTTYVTISFVFCHCETSLSRFAQTGAHHAERLTSPKAMLKSQVLMNFSLSSYESYLSISNPYRIRPDVYSLIGSLFIYDLNSLLKKERDIVPTVTEMAKDVAKRRVGWIGMVPKKGRQTSRTSSG